MRIPLLRGLLVAALLTLVLPSWASTIVYKFRILDDSNAPVAGATITQNTTKSFASATLGNAVVLTLTPVDLANGDYGIAYDPEGANGELIVNYTVSKMGSTITGANASITVVLTKDSSRVLNSDVASSTLGTAANLASVKTQTDKIGTNAADSPNEATAQTAAATAATQATAANGKLLGNIAAQTGDAFARIGAAGAGLTALGDTRLAFLTGDAFARIGLNGAGLSALGDTRLGFLTGDAFARIGSNGAGLTALGDTRLGFLTGDAYARIGANGASLTALLQASAAPTNFSLLAINSSGQVSLNLAQPLDTSNTGDTVGGGLIAARAQGFGKWQIASGHLILYAANGTTVLKDFAITPTPTNATRQ